MPNTKRPCKTARATVQKRTLNNDLVIPGNVAWCDDLPWEIKVFYGIIRVLSKNEFNCCFASNEYLRETLKKEDDSTVRRYLKTLESKDLIKRDSTYVIDDYGGFQYTRALVPIDMYDKFLTKKDEIIDLKGSQKNSPKTVQNCTPTPCKIARQIYNMLPYKENNITPNNCSIYNPQTPLQGGDNAVTSVKTEQFEILGKFNNVRLTQSQKAAFSEEFGAETLSALIEQLSAYIQSGVKRIRKKANHYAILRDWALRRKERAQNAATDKRALVGDDISRREYTDNDINALFSPLDETD